jgi:hypothetical protein
MAKVYVLLLFKQRFDQKGKKGFKSKDSEQLNEGDFTFEVKGIRLAYSVEQY